MITHSFPDIEVLWLDHHASETNKPLLLEEIEALCKPAERLTRGWLVCETKSCIAVAYTIEEDGTVTEVDYIVKRLIKKRSDK